jgi:hypothetical protein
MVTRAKEQYAKGPDPREADLVETMILDSMEYIHGKGFEPIVKQLKTSTDTQATMAAIAYKTVRGVAEKNKATARVDMDMDMLMGVTTECIDMVTEVAQAAGQVEPGSNVQQLKEDVLLKVTVLHGEQMQDENGQFPIEMKQAAAADLRDYMSDAGAQKAMDYVNNRAKAEGVNPQDMIRAGNEAVFGSKNPLAEGVNRGLMAQTLPYKEQDSVMTEAAADAENPNLTLPDGQPIPSVEEIQAQMDAQGLGGQPSPQSPQNLPPGFRPYTRDEMQNLDPGGTVSPQQMEGMNQRQMDTVWGPEQPLMQQPLTPDQTGGY